MTTTSFPVSQTQCFPIVGLRPGVSAFVATAAAIGLEDGNWPDTVLFDGLPLTERYTRDNPRGERLGYVYTSPTEPVTLYLLD
jgi:hypothetical protein